MQYLKGDIQERILNASEEVFLEKGYKDASMREIASRSGVTVSNIYHYFTNKDELFRTILKPVLNDLYAMIYNHDADKMTLEVFIDSESQRASVQEYIELVSEHRDRLRLLLFQAQGSELENFRSEYTDLMTRTISVFFQGMKQKYPHINIVITDFFIHLNTVWLFTLLEELVLHPVKREEMQKFIAEYIAFETAGWKELMKA
ncbi:TetR/AcrR family transcriptional regulator [uncultured Bacteroides sp.]|uniref:TetR/AcrR family transcriptional regulator n=1 Tax=uncultured Bacteroides sp. TaxID=162156 RepID=UPI0025D9E14A|nr:TetR/AcrR family transcriptional regulator [uncultured Bacteroides sp.]